MFEQLQIVIENRGFTNSNFLTVIVNHRNSRKKKNINVQIRDHNQVVNNGKTYLNYFFADKEVHLNNVNRVMNFEIFGRENDLNNKTELKRNHLENFFWRDVITQNLKV